MTRVARPVPTGCALITGASRGIGAACATALASREIPVAITYRQDEAGANETARRVRDMGAEVVSLRADVTNPTEVEDVFSQLEQSFGYVKVLVNNAGIRADCLAAELDDDRWHAVLNVDLTAAFQVTRRALLPMVRARWGRVINISSAAGIRASRGQANYAAAKAGMIGFTKAVSAEVARRGVTANVVAPGLIDTSFIEGFREEMLRAIPAGRLGSPEEVGECVRFLASPAAAYITGAVVPVDGGLTA